jgi:hypothetical protein
MSLVEQELPTFLDHLSSPPRWQDNIMAKIKIKESKVTLKNGAQNVIQKTKD